MLARVAYGVVDIFATRVADAYATVPFQRELP